MRTASSIDDYLAGVEPERRQVLERLRKHIRAVVPAAEECISYRIPAFRFEGKIVAGFSSAAWGGSYFPFSGRTLRTLAEELAGYEMTKSSLHFTIEAPLPLALVRKLLRTRIREIQRVS